MEKVQKELNNGEFEEFLDRGHLKQVKRGATLLVIETLFPTPALNQLISMYTSD